MKKPKVTKSAVADVLSVVAGASAGAAGALDVDRIVAAEEQEDYAPSSPSLLGWAALAVGAGALVYLVAR